MSFSRHLVDPEIYPILELPDMPIETPAGLQAVRDDPRFDPSAMPPPPFELGEAFAPVKDAPDVKLVIINPPSDKTDRPAILHLHGGGMVLGSADMARMGKPDLAKAMDVVIVSVDYRLAPETRFPGPQEDNYAGLLWLVENAASLGVDPGKIFVMGESAGGGLAASLSLMARDRKGPKIAGQILTYPMLDWRTGGPDDQWGNAHTGEFIWTRARNQFGWNCLRGDYEPTDARKGWFSPALADDLSNLPPTYMITGMLDLFLDEDLEFARRLIDAGVWTELHCYPGAVHAFDMVPETTLAAQTAMNFQEGFKRMLRLGQ